MRTALEEQSTPDLLAALFPPLRTYCPILRTVSVPQALWLLLEETEALYGGAVGGGKTGALLMDAIKYVDVPGYAALILRRTFPELEQPDGPIPQSLRWFAQVPEPERPIYNKTDHEWVFPSGAVLRFGHLDHPNAMLRYQGGGYHFFGFDELTHFEERAYEFIGFSRTRRPPGGPLSQVPMRVRATANPGGPGHVWVMRRFLTKRKRDVAFIPAKLADNPGIDQADYVTRLERLHPTLRQQLLEGDWDAVENAAYEVTDDHLVDSFRLEDGFHRFEACDYGLNGAPWALWAVDYEGNLVGVDVRYWRDQLPSDIAPEIIELRKAYWGLGHRAYADPSIWHRTGAKNRWGAPAMLADEFSDNGVPLLEAINDPRAGMTRLRELLKLDHGDPDPEASRPPHRFPSWHLRAGEPGAPRIFFVRGAFDPVVEELRAAPLQRIDKRDGGEIVDPDWESRNGHAAAMCRYAVMTRPRPSKQPDEPLDDPRAELLRRHRENLERPRARRTDYVT